MKYALLLNDMRQPNIENLTAVAVAHDKQTLIDFHNEHLAPERWTDGRWGKTFKAGSPLEWFNPGTLDEDDPYFGGIYTVPDGLDVPIGVVVLSKA